jgi:hypothetical protein
MDKREFMESEVDQVIELFRLYNFQVVMLGKSGKQHSSDLGTCIQIERDIEKRPLDTRLELIEYFKDTGAEVEWFYHNGCSYMDLQKVFEIFEEFGDDFSMYKASFEKLSDDEYQDYLDLLVKYDCTPKKVVPRCQGMTFGRQCNLRYVGDLVRVDIRKQMDFLKDGWFCKDHEQQKISKKI